MKLSLKLQDEEQQNPLLKAKIPITIFNQPFISSLTTRAISTSKAKINSSSDLSFSLSTNFPSGPSLNFSYTPTTNPFSLSLKSGLGLFGSPHDSPLIFSAKFSLSPTNRTTLIPFFCLHFKPQFGDFSLHKTTSSNPNPEPNSGSHSVYGVHLQSGSSSNGESSNGFTRYGSLGWQELKLEPYTSSDNGFTNPNPSYINGVRSNNGIGSVPESPLVLKSSKSGGLSCGISVMARTVLPLTKRVMMNLRWGVNGPADSLSKMPYLTLNKIGIERAEEVKEVKKKEKNNESDVNDLELLKGTCFWMRRDLELLQKENKDMKQCLEDMRLGVSTSYFPGESGVGKKVSMPLNGNSNEFERWRSKKNAGEENGGKELKKPANHVSNLENELQKAIKAASS